LGVGVGVGSTLGEGVGAALYCTLSTLAPQEKGGVLSQKTNTQQGGPFLQGTLILVMGALAPPDVPALPSG